MSWAIAAVAVIALVALVLRRRTHHEPGILNFRRHIDALSPEARREVLDRVRPRPPVGMANGDHHDRDHEADRPVDGGD